ncbi:MAG TPA: NAD(P)-dependent oxidoreductase [Candidatus Dormibacteraeota bacterium]|jgi:phosphoglycerate dehydrogenase-like enzyme
MRPDFMAGVHAWIPDGTLPQHRALLPGSVTVHLVPADAAPLPDHLGTGQFLVAAFEPERLDQVIRRLDGLRVVQTMSAGVDHFAGRIPEGVTLCDGSGIHDVPVAEWVVMVVLASLHHLPGHLASQRDGAWRRPPDGGGDDLERTTVLIVGHGSIGRAVEERMRPFGASFLRVAMHRREGVWPLDQLPSLLPQAGVVVILVPLTEATRGLVDAKFLGAMQQGALLVNASRGPIVDTEALYEALRARRVRAALDVTDPEPLPAGDPLWSAPGLILTPHVAGSVSRRLDRSWALIADQMTRFVEGAPLRNIVADGY